jgi:hypothetical protein
MSAPTFVTLGPSGTCHEHALLHRQEVFVVDTFMFPAKEMELIVRRDVREPRSLGIVAAAMGYQDLGEWETVVQEPANPIVACKLLAGFYDAGVTFVALAAEHPRSCSCVTATARWTRRGSCTANAAATRAS